jgi:CheY-like chemotaxis protein
MLITVTDENEPIDKSVKEKMFLSYNTSNTNTGTGLGLYICKKIIDLHGGHIYHEYPSITGNKFVIDLKMKVCNSSKNIECVSIAPSSNNSVETSGFKQLARLCDERLYSPETPVTPKKCDELADIGTRNIEKLVDQVNEEIRPPNISEKQWIGTLTDASGGKMSNSQLLLTPRKSLIIQDKTRGDPLPNKHVVSTQSSEHNKIRIAVVDDSELSRKLLTRLIFSHKYLSTRKYKLYESVDGLDAVSTLQNIIDYLSIIFMDNIMPNITGILASKIIRGLGYNNLIFGITGNGLNEDIDEFITNGADFVFIKPFKKEKLDMVFKFVETYGFTRQPGKKIVEANDKKSIIWVDC